MRVIAVLCAAIAIPAVGFAQDAADDAKMKMQDKLDALIATVQDQIELDPELAGVMLTDAKFEDKMGGGETLQLEGKVTDPVQKEKVKTLVMNEMAKDKFWSEGEGELDWGTDKMMVAQGSLPLANRYYAQGLEQFWSKNYAHADRAFSRALAETPNDDVLKYWDAVAALAQGNTDRAKTKLEPLLEMYPHGSRTPLISAAFEKLQGPLRKQLMALEDEILAKL